VQHVTGNPGRGDTVTVVAADGRPLALAAYSASSQIVGRAWSFAEIDRVRTPAGEHTESLRALDPATIDAAWIADRVTGSAERRAHLSARGDAARLVFAESDGLPGVIADRYGPWVVVELTSAGADRWRDALADALVALPGVQGVYERSDLAVREREGLAPRSGVLRGPEPPERITITEDGRCYDVDVRAGHKTGFYLDQRDNRATVQRLATGRRVLDVFAYTGGFSVAAYAGGAAEVTTVDSSGPALASAAANLAANGFPTGGVVEADAFAELRRRKNLHEQFDLIVLDPPKLAHRADQADKASRAYKDANLQALHLLAPGGVLVTFSCSGAIDDALFQKIVFGAALDARRDAWIVGKLTQAEDHPVALTFPEAAYLKGLVIRAG
jgi:23S rRNA (cytosine1962-C5)-methyltransferase